MLRFGKSYQPETSIGPEMSEVMELLKAWMHRQEETQGRAGIP